jgi:hypothetical protein
VESKHSGDGKPDDVDDDGDGVDGDGDGDDGGEGDDDDDVELDVEVDVVNPMISSKHPFNLIIAVMMIIIELMW